MLKLVHGLKSINRIIALVCGIILLLTTLFILIEITLRALSFPNMGGADEYAGYVMAGLTAWGLSFALTEHAHIRIDMAVSKLGTLGRDIIDVFALSTIAAVAITVAVYGWNVVSKSLVGGSHANTPLETPLWIPQMIWWSGWAWFAVTAGVLTIVAIALLVSRRSTDLRALAGNNDEVEINL